MTMLNPTIVKAIKANGLLKEGHYAYRSGQHSAWLIDRLTGTVYKCHAPQPGRASCEAEIATGSVGDRPKR